MKLTQHTCCLPFVHDTPALTLPTSVTGPFLSTSSIGRLSCYATHAGRHLWLYILLPCNLRVRFGGFGSDGYWSSPSNGCWGRHGVMRLADQGCSQESFLCCS